jgi:serine/threonine protein kinase
VFGERGDENPTPLIKSQYRSTKRCCVIGSQSDRSESLVQSDTTNQPSSRAAFLAAGTRLGRYELIRRLAVGGMAELYLARATGIAGFEKLVALKRILPQYAESADFVSMFLDEARLAATIQHPNVAQVYDIGQSDEGLYFTMEYIHGEDVRGILSASARRQGGLPLEHAIAMATGAAAGLHAAHELTASDGTPLGLVHRDVSPSNVLVSYTGGVKIIDFGIAKAARRQTETRVGTLKGKVSYMSPEQCLGGSIDCRSDVFALGILLWEMTVGRRLFDAESEYMLLRQIVDEDAPRPSSVKRGYPSALETIVMGALRRNRDERYGSAQELQLELEEFARRRGLGVSTVGLSRFVRELFPQRAATLPDGGTADSGIRRHPAATGTPQRVTRDEESSVDVQIAVEPGLTLGTTGSAPRLDRPSTSRLPPVPLAPSPPPRRPTGQPAPRQPVVRAVGTVGMGTIGVHTSMFAPTAVGSEVREADDDGFDAPTNFDPHVGGSADWHPEMHAGSAPVEAVEAVELAVTVPVAARGATAAPATPVADDGDDIVELELATDLRPTISRRLIATVIGAAGALGIVVAALAGAFGGGDTPAPAASVPQVMTVPIPVLTPAPTPSPVVEPEAAPVEPAPAVVAPPVAPVVPPTSAKRNAIAKPAVKAVAPVVRTPATRPPTPGAKAPAVKAPVRPALTRPPVGRAIAPAVKAPVGKAPAVKAPAGKAPAVKPPAGKSPAKPAARAPGKAPAKPTAKKKWNPDSALPPP